MDGKELRALLVKEGARLDEPPQGYWKEIRETKGDYFVNSADVIAIYNGDQAATKI